MCLLATTNISPSPAHTNFFRPQQICPLLICINIFTTYSLCLQATINMSFSPAHTKCITWCKGLEDIFVVACRDQTLYVLGWRIYVLWPAETRLCMCWAAGYTCCGLLRPDFVCVGLEDIRVVTQRQKTYMCWAGDIFVLAWRYMEYVVHKWMTDTRHRMCWAGGHICCGLKTQDLICAGLVTSLFWPEDTWTI